MMLDPGSILAGEEGVHFLPSPGGIKHHHSAVRICRKVWRGENMVVKEFDLLEIKAAKVIPGCSLGTSNAAVREEFGMQSLISRREVRTLKRQYRLLQKMRETILPNIAGESALRAGKG